MKRINLLFTLIPALLLSACGKSVESKSSEEQKSSSTVSSEIESTISSETTSEEPVTHFTVSDVPYLFYESPVNVKYNFIETEPEQITYEFDSDLIEIENDIITLKQNVNVDTHITVRAKTPSYLAEFDVVAASYARPKSISGTHGNHFNEYKNRVSALSTSDFEEGGTIFVGDSFFDPGFWGNFNKEVSPIEGKTRLLSGISATTMEEWIGFSYKLLYQSKPANIVFHIGTNDFWDLQRSTEEVEQTFTYLMDEVRYHLPNTKIYYISIENRSYAPSQYGSTSMIKQLKAFNSYAKEYCDKNDNMVFLDSFSHFTDENGYILMDLFKDGTHPINEEYSFYVKTLIELGLTDITLNEIYTGDWKFSEDQAWGGTTTAIRRDGKVAKNKFVLTTHVDFSFNGSKNCHFGFQFQDVGNRFLLWNNSSGNKLYYCGALGGTYHSTSTHYADYPTVSSLDIKILVSVKHAYMFINDDLRVVFANIWSTDTVSVASENMNVEFSNISLTLAGDDSGLYETEMNSEVVKQYESLTSYDLQYIEVK